MGEIFLKNYRTYFSLILVIALIHCKKQNLAMQVKREIKYVKPLSGLWLREAPTKSAKTLYLLPYSMSVEISDPFAQNELIDGVAGNWRKTQYGAYTGYAFDGYLADDYAQLMRSNQYVDPKINSRFLSFQTRPVSDQNMLIDEIIKENNTIGDPIIGNRTGSHCLYAIEWRYCDGAIATKGNYSQKSYAAFVGELKANILNPKTEFFDAHLKCIVMVGCYACDGGYFVAKKVLIPHLVKALQSTKIVSITDSASEAKDRKEYVVHAESASPLTDYQKHVTFIVNQDMGAYQIIAALGDYSRNLRDSLKDKCYP